MSPILVEGEPRWMWTLRVSWWHRQKMRLWLHFLPRRVLCAIRGGHKWGSPDPSIIYGPIDLTPREREWVVLGASRWCKRCNAHRDYAYSDAERDAWIEEAIAEDDHENVVAADVWDLGDFDGEDE